ncbi:MAG: alanine racemase [Gammaproteobacteria bacterium]|nr:alanine racemase [Gammaproteobacteria bacterium]
MSFGARALIRLAALRHNFNVIKSFAPDSKIMAVIKANAYGHGMVAVAQSLVDVDAFAVARVPEAVKLRENGITTRIVLLAGVLNESELAAALQWNLEPVVHCPEQVELLLNCDQGALPVWLKFDTGMNRLGFAPQDAADLLARLGSMASVGEIRLMTHLASADELDNSTTAQQIESFERVCSGFAGDVSIANTPAALAWKQVVSVGNAANWIRPGIALFGISPFADKTAAELGLQPVMQFEARLIANKALAAGARVGYKGAYVAAAGTRMGILSAGYGDGYSRHFRSGTPVLLNGRRVPVIGNVSMDMIAVDLGPGATDQVGDIATLWGDGLAVEEVAPWADAIPYELLCGVMNREASEIVL